MAIEYTTNKQSFTGAVDVIQFTFQIPYFETSDINVTREDTDGTITKLTYAANPVGGDQFKVDATNNNPADGGRITLGTDSTVGSVYTIERIVPFTQQYNLQNGSTIDPAALNKALDRVVAQNQQQNNDLAKSIIFPTTDPDTTTYDVDSTTNRANKALGFDENGNVTEIDLVSTGAVSGDTSAGISIADNIIRAKVDNSTTQFSDGNIAVKTVGTSNVADEAVTFAKMQHITENRVIGRPAGAGTGDPQEIFIDHDLTTVSLGHDTLPSARASRDYVDGKVLKDNLTVIVTQGTGGGNSPSATTVVMTGGMNKTFSASDYGYNASLTIQAAINAIPRNLNNNTVYFKFGLESSQQVHNVTIENTLYFNHFNNGQFIIRSANPNDFSSTSTYAKLNRLISTGTSIEFLISFRNCSDMNLKGMHLEQSTGFTPNKSVIYAFAMGSIFIERCYIEGVGTSGTYGQRGVIFGGATKGWFTYSFVYNVHYGLEIRDGSHIYSLDADDLGTSSPGLPAVGSVVTSGILQPRGTIIDGSVADYQTAHNGLIVNSNSGTILTTSGNL